MTNREKAQQEQHTPWSEEIQDDIKELRQLTYDLGYQSSIFDGAPDAVFDQIDTIVERIKHQIKCEADWLNE